MNEIIDSDDYRFRGVEDYYYSHFPNVVKDLATNEVYVAVVREYEEFDEKYIDYAFVQIPDKFHPKQNSYLMLDNWKYCENEYEIKAVAKEEKTK